MQRISARHLAGFQPAELWEILRGRFVLVFEDGEIETNSKETLYSSYGWEFHRRYPQTPMLKKHHVQEFLMKERLNSNTHLNLLGSIMNTTQDTYMGNPNVKAEELWELTYRVTNEMYNDLSYRLEAYVVSMDMTNFIEVMQHPRALEARANMKESPESIEATYGVLTDMLMNGKDLPTNPISLAVRAKTASLNQVMQCVGPIGYNTDTDSKLFRFPIMRGYAQGLRSIYDSGIESRKAAMALQFAKSPLQDVEYFSRRMQLMDQTVQNLHMEDCGTTEYLHWYVRGPIWENGIKVFNGDLGFIEGKYYLDDATGQLAAVKKDDKHLIGKTLKMRSVIHCAHRDPYGFCATCFGEMSLSIPEGTNMGQICCTSMAQKTTQGVLSTKHLLGSSKVEPILIRPEEAPFLKAAPDGNSYLLADALKGKNVTLVIGRDSAPAITDIMEVKRIEDLNIANISAMRDIGIKIKKGDTETLYPVRVGMSARPANMTYPLLQYVRTMGWRPNEKNNYEIDMREWDWSKPILTLPLMHFSMSDHSKDMAEMLESSVKEMEKRDSGVSPDAFLAEFYGLVNKRLSVNLAVLEVIVYATMIVSAEDDNYQLPKPWTSKGLGVMELTMDNRSLAAAMAYEGHYDNFIEPASFVRTNRMDHLMDGILCPGQLYNDPNRH